jgi:hypothetical protein
MIADWRGVRFRYDEPTAATLSRDELLIAYRASLAALDREAAFRAQLVSLLTDLMDRVRPSDRWTTSMNAGSV